VHDRPAPLARSLDRVHRAAAGAARHEAGEEVARLEPGLRATEELAARPAEIRPSAPVEPLVSGLPELLRHDAQCRGVDRNPLRLWRRHAHLPAATIFPTRFSVDNPSAVRLAVHHLAYAGHGPAMARGQGTRSALSAWATFA